MSYSRWITSYWYTFWNESESGEKKEDQVLTVMGSEFRELNITYKELEDDKQSYMDEVYVTFEDIKKEELEELEDYIDAFMRDVEETFGS